MSWESSKHEWLNLWDNTKFIKDRVRQKGEKITFCSSDKTNDYWGLIVLRRRLDSFQWSREMGIGIEIRKESPILLQRNANALVWKHLLRLNMIRASGGNRDATGICPATVKSLRRTPHVGEAMMPPSSIFHCFWVSDSFNSNTALTAMENNLFFSFYVVTSPSAASLTLGDASSVIVICDTANFTNDFLSEGRYIH